MLKEFLAKELEKDRVKWMEQLQQYEELQAMRREARGLAIPEEQKRELAEILTGRLAGKRGVLKLINDRSERFTGFLEAIRMAEEKEQVTSDGKDDMSQS